MENNIKITGSVKVNGASFKGAVNAGNNIDGCIAERGVAGFSPIANVVTNGDDVTITITDYRGTTTATIPDMSDEVERIESLIPHTASPTNKLVDSATLDSSVQTATSNFRGDWATYADIPTDVSLYPVDAAGIRTPSTNDYLVVVADEEQNGGTWRYKYVGLWSVDGKNGWQAEYQVNETPFTADQLAAINSGITSELVEEIGQGGGGLDDKITNCLLEVPQNIKLELNDGVLTLKAGSVVIVPYGTEDLTSQYPVGSTFLHENFKVYDTQFTDGKFFVWAEIQNDTSCVCGNSGTRVLFVGRDGKGYDSNITLVISGSTPSSESSSTRWYDISANLIKESTGSEWVLSDSYLSFPFAVATADTNKIFTSLDQVFNGFGYIGSTVWVDKGVKGLIPNGRNEDGTLRNNEFTTSKVLTTTAPKDTQPIRLEANKIQTGTLLYNETENINTFNGERRGFAIVGTVTGDSNNKVTSLQPKLPVHLVDRNEFEEVIAITETYVSGTSGYRVYSNGFCEQWGRADTGTANGSTVNVTLLRKYKDTNGYCLVTSNKITFPGGGGVTYGTSGAYFVNGSTIQISVGASGGNPKQWFTGGYLA